MIRFESNSHWYGKDGSPQHDADLRVARKEKLYPSVTTIDKDTFKNDFLDRWKMNELVAAAAGTFKQPHESNEDYANRIYEDSLEKSRVASVFGKEIHDAIEHYPQLSLNQKLAPWLDKFGRWFEDHVGEAIYREKVLLDHNLGVAGRCDLIAAGRGPFQGQIIIPDWKGLALDTPLPTPEGWTTMGEVSVGDVLLGASSNQTKVIDKSKIFHRPYFKITFDDASEITCDDTHLWTVDIREANGRKRNRETLPTRDIYDLKQRKAVVTVSNAKPISGSACPVPIDPYLLGVWLGDGGTGEAKVTLGESKKPIVSEFRRHGFDIAPTKNDHNTYYIKGFVGLLNKAGVLNKKHVPAPYLRSSHVNRLMLLRGLMDTDGNWNAKRKQACFDSTDKNLAGSVYELVVSLGWRASMYNGIAKGFGVESEFWRVSFTPFGESPFLKNTKNAPQALLNLEGTRFCRRRCISDIEPTESVPTQCIYVDAKDSLYLAGRQMVPTHNTQNVKKKGDKKVPAFYDSWPRQLGFYAVSYAKEAGIFPGPLPTCISVVIDSNEPETPFMRVWEAEEILRAYEDFVAGAWLWMRKRKFWPAGEWKLSPSIPMP